MVTDATGRTTAPTGRTFSGPGKVAFRHFTGAHAALYRLTGGRFGRQLPSGRGGRSPVLLLVTTGRKSGKRRTSPLLYLADGQDLVVVGSAGGAASDPGWVHNLRANPTAQVEIGRRKWRVTAEEARGEQHERLWPRLVAMFPNYDQYQQSTSREIPVIILRPAAEVAGRNGGAAAGS